MCYSYLLFALAKFISNKPMVISLFPSSPLWNLTLEIHKQSYLIQTSSGILSCLSLPEGLHNVMSSKTFKFLGYMVLLSCDSCLWRREYHWIEQLQLVKLILLLLLESVLSFRLQLSCYHLETMPQILQWLPPSLLMGKDHQLWTCAKSVRFINSIDLAFELALPSSHRL